MIELALDVDTTEQTRVFLSYSRKDGERCRHVAEALGKRNCALLIDVEEINVAEDWRGRLEELIRHSDVVVFAMSANSLTSEHCAWEIERARELSKRLLPLVLGAIDPTAVPAELARLNWIDVSNVDAETFDEKMNALAKAAAIDIHWVREHTRLVDLATRWHVDDRAETHLLRTRAIDDAQAWAARRGPHGPVLPPILLDYLGASRAKEEADRARLERSEHEARLKAAAALFERAMAQIKDAEPHAACQNLLQAISTASPAKVPGGFAVSDGNNGWASKQLTLLAHTVVTLPERAQSLPWSIGSVSGDGDKQLSWFDSGDHVAWIADRGIEIGALARPEAPPQRWGAQRGRAFAVVGAAHAPRVCALFVDGVVAAHDLASGMEHATRFEYALADDDRKDDVPFAIAVSDDGALILIARRPLGDAKPIVDVYDFGPLDGCPRISARLPEGLKNPRWASFARGTHRFAVAADDTLLVFADDGTLARRRGWSHIFGAAASSDLTQVVTASYDLARLSRPLPDRAHGMRNKDADEEFEEVVLEGADGTLSSLAFIDDGLSLIGWSHGGVGVLWSPEATVERGQSFHGATITESFGRSNRARPAMRLNGLGNIRTLVVSPTRTRDVLVASDSTMQIWRFPRREFASMAKAPLNGSAAIAFSATGRLAAASQNGVWMLDSPVEATEPRHTAAVGRVVWDVDWFEDEVVFTYDGKAAALMLDMEYFGEDIAQMKTSASCLDAGPVRWIGTHTGEVWRWEPHQRGRRWCALGLGRLKRIRVHRERGFGVAVGEENDEDDPVAGIATFRLDRPGMIWRCDTLYPNDVDISPDGTLILVADNLGGAIVLDAATGALVSSIVPQQSDPSKPAAITSVCFNHDGRGAYIGLFDGTLVLADIQSGETLTRWRAHRKYVSDIALDPARGLVATASPVPESKPVVVCRAWDVAIMGGERKQPEWPARLVDQFEQRFGAASNWRRRTWHGFVHVDRQDEGDPLSKARDLMTEDTARADDLFARAWIEGHGDRMREQERVAAARTLIAAGLHDLAGPLLAGPAGFDPEVSFELGLQKKGAQGRLDDWLQALPHFELAAKSGHIDAAKNLAYFYDNVVRGNVGWIDWRKIAHPNDPVEVRRTATEEMAIHWLEISAKLGSVDAALRLSQLFEAEGALDEAQRCFRRAAELGYPSAVATSEPRR